MVERKPEKVTWEVKECSRRKVQNCQAKNLHKKDTHDYNNCYELHSREILKSFRKKLKLKKIIFNSLEKIWDHSIISLGINYTQKNSKVKKKFAYIFKDN